VSTDRERVLARVRAALAERAVREPMPDYPDDTALSQGRVESEDSVAHFLARLGRAGGRGFTEARTLGQWLVERGAVRGYCDPYLVEEIVPAFPPRIAVETKFFRDRIDDYTFGITRAVGAIAETGSIIVDDRTTSSRLAALAPWIHVAVVRRSAIHLAIADAVRALGSDPNVVWCTGPSRTADVEGIIIEGVHGPGEQVALVVM
jgi:L-lactate dehydrogenase complex protein LldG